MEMDSAEQKKIAEMPERIKKGVYAELPKLVEIIKVGAIEREMGVISGWVSAKLKNTRNGKYSVRKFSEDDVRRLNEGVWRLADKLMRVKVEYSPDRATCAANVKEALKDVFMKELALRKLGWSKIELGVRTSVGASMKYRPQFTEADVEALTIGVREVAVAMLAYEYFLDKE